MTQNCMIALPYHVVAAQYCLVTKRRSVVSVRVSEVHAEFKQWSHGDYSLQTKCLQAHPLVQICMFEAWALGIRLSDILSTGV